jgi:hypothetical protein
MEIPEKHQKRIEEIIADIKCPKNFACYHSGFKDMCRGEDIGLDNYLSCLENFTSTVFCPFSLSFGNSYLCRCPLRVYVAKNLDL